MRKERRGAHRWLKSSANNDDESKERHVEGHDELTRLRLKLTEYELQIRSLSAENACLNKETKGIVAIKKDCAEAVKRTTEADDQMAKLKKKYKKYKEDNVEAMAHVKALTDQVKESDQAKKRLAAMTASYVKGK